LKLFFNLIVVLWIW